MQRHILFWPRPPPPPPLVPWGGSKRSNIIKHIKIQLQSQFQRILSQTLRVFSEMKDIKHIRRDFHLAAWVMPQEWDLGVPWGVGGGQFFSPKFNQIWRVRYLHECHMQQHHFLGHRPLGPWGGTKRSNIIKSELQSQFQSFLNQTLCIFSQMKYTETIKLCPLDVDVCQLQMYERISFKLSHYQL